MSIALQYIMSEAPFTPEQEAQHARDGFVCLAAAEIRGAEDGTFHLHILKLFVPTEWCPTPACTSDRVEAVRLMGSPSIITDRREHDLLLFAYEGHCSKCHVHHSGGFGYYSDGSNKPFTGIGWLFNAGKLVARS
jgi:hypothetical protein